jgi:hypothetical protein
MEEKIETKKSSIFPIVLILVVLVILVGVWYWWTKIRVIPANLQLPSGKTAEKITTKEDSVAAINQDLDKVEILNLDQELQEIDQDLNSL